MISDRDRMLMVQEAVSLRLAQMQKSGHFDITTIRDLAELVRAPTWGNPTFEFLRTLHCVNFGAMSPALRARIPAMVAEVLSTPSVNFESVRVKGLAYDAPEMSAPASDYPPFETPQGFAQPDTSAPVYDSSPSDNYPVVRTEPVKRYGPVRQFLLDFLK